MDEAQKARLLCKGANLYHVFVEDYRFHEGVRDRSGPHLFGPLHHKIRWNVEAEYVLRGGLGYFPRLAKPTPEIASRRCQRQGSGSGKDVEKGVPLDGVWMKGARIRVDQAVAFPIPILTHPAKTPLPFGNPAPLGAEFTLDLSSTKGSEIGGELCLDEAFLGHLCPHGFGKTEEGGAGKGTETRPAKLQELPFRHNSGARHQNAVSH